MTKKHEILLSQGEKNRLAEVMQVSRMTVYRALNFQRDTIQAKKIRHVAMTQFGGVEVKPKNN